ncbi:metallo-peptidase, Clan MG, Family M24 [Leishmania infantum JPCM5]|uniref:Aminopeptidase_P1_-_putative n=2 Tax=Leishmania infantum TaxID=5671 RepID=A0A6L0Y3T1_LEIIN|nr:metallo-peptidase, Clan MG, Family M24 [Leishmania infantum JPCM5]CAC9552586.1 aminopeptidase_P1_-_putative [Leishmania infantum]CAM73055.1 metallo-peptidase, Clan MG, Family M24 [Leishmania infantum JPCM5]SUZ46961.1 aminopeptidase_P1_-_putative [Leishmania infantum]|eukprot:XP_001469939.1 metallo-peptidase, Clan MG, Family M24 [Leishmania infantum JPCM5]
MLRRLRRAWRTAPAQRHSVPLTLGSTRWVGGSAAVAEEVSAQEYADRRRRFLECLPDNSIVLLPAADESLYSHDILWPHRQDSLWYHLFGMRVPMRRQLAPPSSAITEDVRITIAAFAKGMKGIPTQTLLCVPPVTTDTATLVWGSEAVPLSQYKRLLCADADGGMLSPCTHENVVTTNEVGTVCAAVRRLITDMAQQQVKEWAEHSGVELSTLSGGGGGGEGVQAGRLLALGVLPRVFAAYPQQLRWDGRGYRLRQPAASMRLAKARDVADSTSVFRHPLEAFFSTLSAMPFVVHLPRPLPLATAAAPGQQPTCSVVAFRYSAVAGHTPGLVPSTANALPKRGRVPCPLRGRDSPAAVATASASADSEPDATMQLCLPVRRSDAYAWLYRQFKGPSQLRQHLRSARATEDAFLQLMYRAPATLSEHALHCAFQRAVCDISAHAGPAAQVRCAYIPVVASGVRGSEIHFTDNDGVAAPGDVVRVDAGVEVDGVPTDCARTLPIGSSRFPSSYVPLYEGLLQIQRKLLRCMKPGASVRDMARMHIDETRALLCLLGVDVRRAASSSATPSPCPHVSATATSSPEQQVPLALVRSCFCAHLFGHFFGLDIHEELSSVSRPLPTAAAKEEVAQRQRPTPRILQGGMMHTVEPGVYVPSAQRAALFGLERAHLPIAFHGGVGVQIEDDVLVLPSPDGEDVDVCKGGEPLVRCPWSRGDYLQHALAAFHRYHGSGDAGLMPSLLVSVCGAHVPTVWGGCMTAATQNVLRFLFAQRVAIEGLPKAKASVETDVCAIQQQTFVPNPAYSNGPPVPHAAVSDWYPYSSIVLTATIPKDIALIEAVMRQ